MQLVVPDDQDTAMEEDAQGSPVRGGSPAAQPARTSSPMVDLAGFAPHSANPYGANAFGNAAGFGEGFTVRQGQATPVVSARSLPGRPAVRILPPRDSARRLE